MCNLCGRILQKKVNRSFREPALPRPGLPRPAPLPPQRTSVKEQKIKVLFSPLFSMPAVWRKTCDGALWSRASRVRLPHGLAATARTWGTGRRQVASPFSFSLLSPNTPPALLHLSYYPLFTQNTRAWHLFIPQLFARLLLHLGQPALSLFRLTTLPSFFHTVSHTFTANY